MEAATCGDSNNPHRWNGTAENSRDAYFRASEAGIECIETDIHLSADGFLPMIHDSGLGRVTDVGEQSSKAAYNPFTGQGDNPTVRERRFRGDIENLHLRDEGGRVRVETVPTLVDMVQSIYNTGMDVVLQLDFKDKDAVEPAYWALKTLANAAGVPANEWCIYKLQSIWYKTPAEFEALSWVQDAFASGVQLAYIPVYNPGDVGHWDQMTGLKDFMKTNYTISAEIELYSTDGLMQDLLDHVEHQQTPGATFNTSGVFFAIGDFVDPISSGLTFFDTANFSLPQDERVNNSVYTYQENRPPVIQDTLVGNSSVDGHDYRSDFDWILRQGFDWVITDTADDWHGRLQAQGKRNLTYFLAEGNSLVDETLAGGWYRRHARDLTTHH